MGASLVCIIGKGTQKKKINVEIGRVLKKNIFSHPQLLTISLLLIIIAPLDI